MAVGTPTKRVANARSAEDDKPTPAVVDKGAIIHGLNHDLAGEYQAIVMYIQYSAKLTGPYRRELRALFQAEIMDEQGHAQFLADKIASLGGEPTTEPRPTAPTSRRKCWSTHWRPRNKRSRTTTSGSGRRTPSGTSASR